MEGDRSRHGTTREAPDSQMEDVMRSYHTVIVGAEQMMHLWVRYGIVRYDSRHVLYRRPQMKHANPNRIALRPASFKSFFFFPHPPSVTTANGLRVGPKCGPEMPGHPGSRGRGKTPLRVGPRWRYLSERATRVLYPSHQTLANGSTIKIISAHRLYKIPGESE